MWRRESCRYVLPLIATTEHSEGDRGYFRLNGLHCRVSVYREEAVGRCHILFAQDGRFLQLEISGAANLENGMLTMPVLRHPRLRSAQSLALRQLTDLMARGTMRPSLYKPYPYKRVARLIEIVRALDGYLSGATYRDIALVFYGAARVKREWHYPNNYLRDHVCRTVESGLKLMNGGYRNFLT